MNKRGISFWDVLAWLVLGLILVWITLKALGIINTPVLIEYAPYFGAVYLAGWAMSNLVRVTQDVNRIKGNIHHLGEKFNDLDKNVEVIKSNCKRCK